MQTINHANLIDKIRGLQGTIICGLQTLTDAKAKKTNNPFGQIFKQSRFVGFVGANYEGAVNREGNRQGVDAQFEGESLPWGVWFIPNKIIYHNGKFYLRVQWTPGQRKFHSAKVIAYRDNQGKFLSYSDIKEFLPIQKESAKQQNSGLDLTIQVRSIAFDSIQKIRLQGKTYCLNKN